jgi:protein-tyrosine phosphatase
MDLEYAAEYDDDQIRAWALGGGPAVLVEFPWGPTWPLALAPTCRDLRLRGFLPIVAHPERARPVQQRPERLDDVIASGAVCQITNGSLAGRFGETAQRTAFGLLRDRRGHMIASDAHGTASRGPSFTGARKALAQEFGVDYATAIEGAAAAIYEGRTPQLPQPDEPRRRGLFRR